MLKDADAAPNSVDVAVGSSPVPPVGASVDASEVKAKQSSPTSKAVSKMSDDDLWQMLDHYHDVAPDQKDLYHIRSYLNALVPKIIAKSKVFCCLIHNRYDTRSKWRPSTKRFG